MLVSKSTSVFVVLDLLMLCFGLLGNTNVSWYIALSICVGSLHWYNPHGHAPWPMQPNTK